MIGSLRLRHGLVVAGLLALSFAFASGPAQAVPPPPPTPPNGHVYNGASPRCLDSGVPQNAQLWNCSTSIYQQWVLSRGGQIRGNSPAGCLDDGLGLNGSGAALVACNGSLHQKWYGTGFGGSFVNAASGRCLDADFPTLGQQGTKVQVWDCNGGANQYWAFEFTD